MVAVLVALIATTVLGYATYRLDGSRVKRRHALAAAALCASLVWLAADSREARRHMGFYYEDRHLWFFFSSWVETAEALWRGHLLDAAAHRVGPKLTVPASCNPASKPPHMFLIHQESGRTTVPLPIVELRQVSIPSFTRTMANCTSCAWRPMAARPG